MAKYQDAFSHELGHSISASRAAQLFLDGQLSDPQAFKCRVGICDAEMTLVNAGKTDEEIAKAHHFCVPRGRRRHSEDCIYADIPDDASIREREEIRRRRALKCDVDDGHVRFSSFAPGGGAGGPTEGGPKTPKGENEADDEELGNDDHMRSVREVVDRFVSMDRDRRDVYRLHFPKRTEFMEQAFYWIDASDNPPAPMSTNMIYAGIAYLNKDFPQEGFFRVEFYWDLDVAGRTEVSNGRHDRKNRPYMIVPFSDLKNSEFKSYFAERLELYDGEEDTVPIDAFIYGRPSEDVNGRLCFEYQDLSRIHLAPTSQRPDMLNEYLYVKGQGRSPRP